MWYMERFKQVVDEVSRYAADCFLAVSIYEELYKLIEEDSSQFTLSRKNDGTNRIAGLLRIGRKCVVVTLECHYNEGRPSVSYHCDDWRGDKRNFWDRASYSDLGFGPKFLAADILTTMDYEVKNRRKGK